MVADSPPSETPGLVSIGLPVYNGTRFLARALDALLAQTYAPTEIIISDNASEDDTLAIARHYADKHPNIRVFSNATNLGPYPNFRIVLEKARGEFFMWAGCDDLWEATFVSSLVDALRTHGDAVVAQSGFRRRTYKGEDWGAAVIYPDLYSAGRVGLALRVALNFSSEYAIFMYGVFRHAFLRQHFTTFGNFRGSDRLFIAEIALSQRLITVPEVLHIRGVRSDPKYALKIIEAYKVQLDDGNDRSRTLPFAVRMLRESKMIPPQRKVLIPLILAMFTLGAYKHDWKRLKGWGRRIGIGRAARSP